MAHHRTIFDVLVLAFFSQGAANCWTPHDNTICEDNVPGGVFYWFEKEAQDKCSELGLSTCSAVTCRSLGVIQACTLRKCATLTQSFYGEVTWTPPPSSSRDCGWTTHAHHQCDGHVAGVQMKYWDAASAKAKCSELGPCQCHAVTCRDFGIVTVCDLRTCTTPTISYVDEVTYMQNCPSSSAER